jgi:hypothetical protein
MHDQAILSPALGRNALALALALSTAHAGTVRLDDSSSYAVRPTCGCSGDLCHRDLGSSAAEARVRVQIHIDTKSLSAGQQGRVYMVLPLDVGRRCCIE